MASGFWTDHPSADESLRVLLERGKSAAQAAIALNEQFNSAITRNAVIGRAGRRDYKFKFDDRPRQSAEQIRAKKRAARLQRNRCINGHPIKPLSGFVAYEPSSYEPPPAPIQCTVPLLELRDIGQCHYPDGDGPFLYCGRPSGEFSYCPVHADIMYQPARARSYSWREGRLR